MKNHDMFDDISWMKKVLYHQSLNACCTHWEPVAFHLVTPDGKYHECLFGTAAVPWWNH